MSGRDGKKDATQGVLLPWVRLFRMAYILIFIYSLAKSSLLID